MRFLAPFWWMVALGTFCSAGAVAVERLAPPNAAEAVQPAPETSAAVAESSALSNVSPTVVTKATPVPESMPLGVRSEGVAEVPQGVPAIQTVLPREPGDHVGTLRAGVGAAPVAASDPAKAIALLALMNATRTKEGLDELRRDDALDAVALARARNLVANGYFEHYSPDGESAFSELAAGGIRYRLAGENLARNNYPDARTVVAAFDGLMASPGHRANVLEERFTLAGVAVVQSGRMWVYVTVFKD